MERLGLDTKDCSADVAGVVVQSVARLQDQHCTLGEMTTVAVLGGYEPISKRICKDILN